MIKYQEICEINRASERLRLNKYNWHWDDKHNRDSDMLCKFTLEPRAIQHSLDNLEYVLKVAKKHDQDLVVVKPVMIQVAGAGAHKNKSVARDLLPNKWLVEYGQWVDTSAPLAVRVDHNGHGQVTEFWTHRPGMVLSRHQGVYDVATGQRLTNRQQIIQRIWALGFATARGRPPYVARTRWTGTREELEEITQLAARYCPRDKASVVATKIVSTFRTLNRHYAWPGSW